MGTLNVFAGHKVLHVLQAIHDVAGAEAENIFFRIFYCSHGGFNLSFNLVTAPPMRLLFFDQVIFLRLEIMLFLQDFCDIFVSDKRSMQAMSR